MKIPLDRIAEGTRLRSITSTTVDALVASIRDIGLLSPITVYERAVMQGGIEVAGWGLVAGLHRLEACRQLGMTEIDAHVVTLGELERQIAECDENLCGPKLSQAERAMFMRRRKHAYEALHPETRNGAKGNGREELSQNGKATFVDDTAARTGQGRSTIARDAARGDRIDDAVLDQVRGTPLDKGTTLDALAAVPKHQQAAEVERLRHTKPPSKFQVLNEYGEPTETAVVRLTVDEIKSLLTEYEQRAQPDRPGKDYNLPNELEASYYTYHMARAEVFRAALSKIASATEVAA